MIITYNSFSRCVGILRHQENNWKEDDEEESKFYGGDPPIIFGHLPQGVVNNFGVPTVFPEHLKSTMSFSHICYFSIDQFAKILVSFFQKLKISWNYLYEPQPIIHTMFYTITTLVSPGRKPLHVT